MSIVAPPDRPKSVCNRCVIEVFGGVSVLSSCFLDFPVDVRAFVIGLSQITSVFTLTPSTLPFYFSILSLVFLSESANYSRG